MAYFKFKFQEWLSGPFKTKINLQRTMSAFLSIWKMLLFILLQVLIITKILTSNKIAPTCFICFNSQILRNSQSWLCSCPYHNIVIGIWSNMIWYVEGEGCRISQFIQYLLRSVTCERKFDLEKATTDKSLNPFHATRLQWHEVGQ